MKLTTGILGISVAALLFSCDNKEKAELQSKIDSLSAELLASKQVEATLSEIGTLIDTIDANRQALRTEMVEGTSYTNYITRLEAINQHITATENKIAAMEKDYKSDRGVSRAAINRLRSDLDVRSQELMALQIEIERMRGENNQLAKTVNQKDSTIVLREEVIKLREEDIQQLESLVKDINEQTKIKVANLYFDQAQALELAADRTFLAPRKKKETKREALELYKLSFSLGKAEAEPRISELEKDLS